MKKRFLLFPMIAFGVVGCGGSTSSENVSSNTSDNTTSSQISSESIDNTTPTNLFLVGDSTVCSFNDAYYYPRYGYGTQLNQFLNEKVTINNLAISGRSSKSFISESNYTVLTNEISAGDYLVIGFGHNDEKNDDASRFTNPTGSVEDNNSFKYYLYNYYIKMALEKGATPILCTPVVRADTSDNYDGNSGHITVDGNYAQCIRDLGEEYNITVVDLTSLTKNIYTTIGFNEAIYYHAWTTKNPASVDKTHLNIFGAKNVAYLFANEIKNSSSPLKDYVLNDIKAPSKEVDLVSNPNYVEVQYTPFDKATYTPEALFSNFITEDYYGTAFGDTGGSPISASNGYVAEETSQGVFRVGQTGTASPKGKISSSSDGFAMIFRQVDIKKNFKFSADIKVLTTADVKQQGFGLMIRDDIYVNQPTQNAAIKSNYLASGIETNSDGTTSNILFKRENTLFAKENNVVNTLYAVDEVVNASITRIGQLVELEFVYKEITYTKTYYDFDLAAIDSNFIYVGMFATRGTTIECTNVNFEITGDAIEA